MFKALGIKCTIDDNYYPLFTQWLERLAHPVSAWLATSAATDILSAFLLVAFLVSILLAIETMDLPLLSIEQAQNGTGSYRQRY